MWYILWENAKPSVGQPPSQPRLSVLQSINICSESITCSPQFLLAVASITAIAENAQLGFDD